MSAAFVHFRTRAWIINLVDNYFTYREHEDIHKTKFVATYLFVIIAFIITIITFLATSQDGTETRYPGAGGLSNTPYHPPTTTTNTTPSMGPAPFSYHQPAPLPPPPMGKELGGGGGVVPRLGGPDSLVSRAGLGAAPAPTYHRLPHPFSATGLSAAPSPAAPPPPKVPYGAFQVLRAYTHDIISVVL